MTDFEMEQETELRAVRITKQMKDAGAITLVANYNLNKLIDDITAGAYIVFDCDNVPESFVRHAVRFAVLAAKCRPELDFPDWKIILDDSKKLKLAKIISDRAYIGNYWIDADIEALTFYLKNTDNYKGNEPVINDIMDAAYNITYYRHIAGLAQAANENELTFEKADKFSAWLKKNNRLS